MSSFLIKFGPLLCFALAPLWGFAQGIQPEGLLFKSQTLAKDSEFEYSIENGLLYYRLRPDPIISLDNRSWAIGLAPRTLKTRNKKMTPLPSSNDWEIFLGSGLPVSTAHPENPHSISYVLADADEVIVYDDIGRGWWMRHRTQFHKWEMGEWIDSFGQPEAVPFTIPEDFWPPTSMALGRRNEDVKYFEDAQGIEHHWGSFSISTQYLLSKDQRHIFITDLGLPFDFRYEICPPWRGQKRTLKIDASGAMLMAMDEDGSILTRLEDFDTNGMDSILFRYSYDLPAEKIKKNRGHKPLSRWSTYHLSQNDQWDIHPWNLPPGALISEVISIFTTGQGNGARELRVLGKNPIGEIGVYHKNITENGWAFRSLPEGKVLYPEVQFFTPVNRLLNANQSSTQKFSSDIYWEGEKYHIVIDNFHRGCSDSSFTLSKNNKKLVGKLLHDQAYTTLNLQKYPLPHPYLAMITWRPTYSHLATESDSLPTLFKTINLAGKEMFSWRLRADEKQLILSPASDLNKQIKVESDRPWDSGKKGHKFSSETLNDLILALKQESARAKIIGKIIRSIPLKKYQWMAKMIPAHLSFYLEAYQQWEKEIQYQHKTEFVPGLLEDGGEGQN